MFLLRRKAGRDDGDTGKVFNYPARVVDESAFQSVSLSLSGSLRLLAVPQNIYSPDRREVGNRFISWETSSIFMLRFTA